MMEEYSSAYHFNSRPSARGDAVSSCVFSILLISIHAPPRGATGTREIFTIVFSISIHAPPRGATPLLQHWKKSEPISIHAPPRGAT